MKHLFLFTILFVGIISASVAKEVSPEMAKTIAQNLYQQVNQNKSCENIDLVFTCNTKIHSKFSSTISNEVPLYYIFNAEKNKGFVIVSGDDNATPILGYATNGTYNSATLPHNFKKWIENYKDQIRFIITNKMEPTEEIKLKWERLENGLPYNANKSSKSVNPLVSTEWGQTPYVNDMCPYDANAGSANNNHCVTGCPATAMAQIMKFWEHPKTGTGFHSYNHKRYGTLSANFASATYNWGAMPDNVTSSNNAVATLMYHCGVAVEMDYGPTASGSYVIISAAPTPQQTSEHAYKTYFGYDSLTMQGLKRVDYSDNSWIQLMKDDLDESRPIQYAGFGSGGHTFVCDGYDNNDYFHINWGWGGSHDGYFAINALNPGSGGTGSGAGYYNNGQQAIFGIQPNNVPAADIELYESIVATPNQINYGQGFTVHTDIANFGTLSFDGDFAAAIFDDHNNFIEYVEILSGYSLGPNQHYTNGIDFTTTGIYTLLPGSYTIGVYYRPTGGDWVMVDNGSFSGVIAFNVYYSNDIELYQDIIVDCGVNITQNQGFTVTLDIMNDGLTTLDGDYDVSLYNLDGSLAETIQTITGLMPLDPGYFFDDMQFASSGVSISPGSYLLAVMHRESGGNWVLTGSTYFTNPIYVTVQEEAVTADMYENNDLENDAYTLPVFFINDNASVTTTGSTMHGGFNDDFYKIDLDPGYDYNISARTHDSNNSGNGQNYNCDVSWFYLNGTDWSDMYDDVMPGTIYVQDGGSVYFHVSPYFAGQTGSYLLDLSIVKSELSFGTGLEGVSETEQFSFYPNPAIDLVNIEAKSNANISKVTLVDIFGNEVLQINNPESSNCKLSIPIENLSNGAYIMIVQTKNEIWKHKFIKSD